MGGGDLMSELQNHLDEVVNVCWDYAGRLEGRKDHIINAVLGLAGEAGEVADLHKKMFYHTPKDDRDYKESLKHELGDVYFYLLKVQDLYGFTTDEILAANRAKLSSRHPELGQVSERFAPGYIK